MDDSQWTKVNVCDSENRLPETQHRNMRMGCGCEQAVVRGGSQSEKCHVITSIVALVLLSFSRTRKPKNGAGDNLSLQETNTACGNPCCRGRRAACSFHLPQNDTPGVFG